ncbi:MAG: hypothetical protein IJ817_04050 [Clostridia bacterium]|nr:hypothetical protein [Clostridia bacterium]
MVSMLLGLWTNFRKWVSVDWSDRTFYIVLSVLGVCMLLLLVSFFKANINKGKSIKWVNLVLLIIIAAILTVLSIARFK